MLYSNDRTSLFIDGPNLHSAARMLNFQLDFKKVLDHFGSTTQLQRAYYYTAILENVSGVNEKIPIRPLIDWLDYNGYHVVTKPQKTYQDPFGNLRNKGNMDVELAVDMLLQAPHLDHLVLFSGDSDFRYLVEACQRSCKVTVVSTVRSSPPMCADDLRRQADVFIELADMKEIFGRPSYRTEGIYRGLVKPSEGVQEPEDGGGIEGAL